MKLTANTCLGAYRIVEPLGSGGMGHVYKAEHRELGRTVAIKVLPDELSRDAVAVRRFRREARSASRLNHPNICAVFDFFEYGEHSYLVLEYLRGETLEHLLARRGALSLDEALKIASEIASGLAHAHRHGFVHRDLKPANVMMSGKVAKILDFGLVKRAAEAGEITTADLSAESSLTGDGRILGTLPYMPPEQIEGKDCGPRSDIYSLGVLLYEMVTGKRPFGGDSQAAVIAAVMASKPMPVQHLAPDVPRELARTIERCLAREADDRWQSARDLAAALGWMRESADQERTPAQSRASAAPGRLAPPAVVVVAVIVAAGLATLMLRGSDVDLAPALRVNIGAPAGADYAHGVSTVAALSGDGHSIVFVGATDDGRADLWLRDLASADAQPLPGTDGGILPFWSPDGNSVGFFLGRDLRVLDIASSRTRDVAVASLEPRGATWNQHGVIIYAPDMRSGLLRVTAEGETAPRQITEPDHGAGDIGHLWPAFLPNGDDFLYFVDSSVRERRGIYVASLSKPTGRKLLTAMTNALYADGYLLYAERSTLLARRFDVTSLTLAGQPVALAEDLATDYTYLAKVSASNRGTLLYSTLASSGLTRLIWTNEAGLEPEVVSSARQQRNPSLSRDGRFLAVEDYRGSDGDIEVWDLSTGRQWRLLDPTTQALFPILSSSGREVVFATYGQAGAQLHHVRTERTGPARILLTEDHSVMPTDWSPDGDWILLAERTSRGDYDVSALRLDAAPDEGRLLLLHSEAHEISGRFAYRGDYFAYGSTETGRLEVFVQPFPPTGVKCQVSSGGGHDPHWSPSDSSIYYLSPDKALMKADIALDGRCAAGRPVKLFDTLVNTPSTSRNHYEVSPDGRFLLNVRSTDTAAAALSLIHNWPSLVDEEGG